MMKTSNMPLAIEEYINFLNKAENRSDRVLTKARVNENFENYGNAINTFLAYPDVFVDLLSPKDSEFSLYFVQRIVLRVMARYRQSYSTFTRAFSKSFLAFLSRYIFTMLTPGHFAFVVSGTKKQAANIAKEKVVMDLWNKFPLLANEMQSVRIGGKLRTPYVQGIDYAEFRFTHGGQLDVIGSGSSTRGGRRHSGKSNCRITIFPHYHEGYKEICANGEILLRQSRGKLKYLSFFRKARYKHDLLFL